MANDEDRVVRLTSVRTELEAGVIVGGLVQRGIPATMSGVYTANFRTEAPGWVEVLVAEDDLPQAQKVLDDVRAEQQGVDWSLVDVGQAEELDDSEPSPWWRVFRGLCYVLVAVYLIWFAASFIVGLLQGFGFFERFSNLSLRNAAKIAVRQTNCT